MATRHDGLKFPSRFLLEKHKLFINSELYINIRLHHWYGAAPGESVLVYLSLCCEITKPISTIIINYGKHYIIHKSGRTQHIVMLPEMYPARPSTENLVMFGCVVSDIYEHICFNNMH